MSVMMENVPGLRNRGKPIFNRFLRTLSQLGYQYEWRVEQMADFGVPQSRSGRTAAGSADRRSGRHG
ncbi:MAG: DNA cytosine methyltransferase [Dongiaceae bacterium]